MDEPNAWGDEWTLFTGDYEKHFYEVKFFGGEVQKHFWPNAGYMMATDGSDRRFGPEHGVLVRRCTCDCPYSCERV